MKHNLKAELTESMDSLHFSQAQKTQMVHRLLNTQTDAPRQFSVRRAAVFAVAAVLLLGTLTGAAVFTRWSQTAQEKYDPPQEIKEQAEQSGLSVMLEQGNTDTVRAEDQGITITAVQTIVDRYSAELIFRIEGFTLPEGRYPDIWPTVTVDGKTDFYTYQGGDYLMDGEVLEYTHYITFQESADVYFGKEISVKFDSLGIQSEEPAGFPETAVTGNWELRWNFTGTGDAIYITPDAVIGNTGVTLMEAEIGQVTLRTVYRLETYWDGWETLETLQPRLCGVRMKDGTVHPCYASSEGYQDVDQLIYFVESSMDSDILDLSQVDALVFVTDENTESYAYVPIA